MNHIHASRLAPHIIATALDDVLALYRPFALQGVIGESDWLGVPAMAFVTARPSLPHLFSRGIQIQVCSSRPLPRMSSTSNSTATSDHLRPAQVIRRPLPRLLIYDHCPFCLRVRYVLGAKNVKHDLVWLLNDDIESPTALVGRKVVPIFQPEGCSGLAVAESMDICKQLDSDSSYGPPGFFRSASGRKDIAQWMSENADASRRLLRPRHVLAPLPEFVFADAREAFVKNHPLESPSDYKENMANTSEYVARLQSQLALLNDMICCKEYCTEGGLSFDDVDLFPRLRSYTIIRDLKLPEKMNSYIQFHASLAEIPLYDCYAM